MNIAFFPLVLIFMIANCILAPFSYYLQYGHASGINPLTFGSTRIYQTIASVTWGRIKQEHIKENLYFKEMKLPTCAYSDIALHNLTNSLLHSVMHFVCHIFSACTHLSNQTKLMHFYVRVMKCHQVWNCPPPNDNIHGTLNPHCIAEKISCEKA